MLTELHPASFLSVHRRVSLPYLAVPSLFSVSLATLRYPTFTLPRCPVLLLFLCRVGFPSLCPLCSLSSVSLFQFSVLRATIPSLCSICRSFIPILCVVFLASSCPFSCVLCWLASPRLSSPPRRHPPRCHEPRLMDAVLRVRHRCITYLLWHLKRIAS